MGRINDLAYGWLEVGTFVARDGPLWGGRRRCACTRRASTASPCACSAPRRRRRLRHLPRGHAARAPRPGPGAPPPARGPGRGPRARADAPRASRRRSSAIRCTSASGYEPICTAGDVGAPEVSSARPRSAGNIVAAAMPIDEARLDAAIEALTDRERFREAESVVAAAAPKLQRVLADGARGGRLVRRGARGRGPQGRRRAETRRSASPPCARCSPRRRGWA